jgi:[ribosomal protein S18]-alanine N-acetyltransferase
MLTSRRMSDAYDIDAMRERDVADVAAMDEATRMNEDHLRTELARPWARTWVARENDDVVGYLLTWHVSDELHVMNVATRADRRRRGIARSLMKEAVAYARDKSIKHVLLEVRRSNSPAIALYRAFGFFAMGVRAKYYADDEDAVEMVLLFDQATGKVVKHEDEVRLA